MSDKKTPANPPSGNDTFEQEFEKFLRDEETATATIYRKLPAAEPDAGLDARVRARAQRAQRERVTPIADTRSVQYTASESAALPRNPNRWLPAFASAAVLVLAAGVVWRLGPHGWSDRAEPAAAARVNAGASEKAAAPSGVAPLHATADAATATDRSTAAVEENVAQPVSTAPSTFAATPSVSAGGGKSLADRVDSARSTPQRDEIQTSVAKARKPAVAEVQPTQPDANAPGAKPQHAALPKASDQGTAAPPPRMPSAQASPPAPVVSSMPFPANTPSPAADQTQAATPRPGEAHVATTAADGAAIRERKAEMASGALDVTRNAPVPSQAAAQVPPPPPPSGAVRAMAEPTAGPRPSAGQLEAKSARGTPEDEERRQQAFSDHSSTPPDAPELIPPGRPTPAQLAAWPAPNCHAVGSGTPDSRAWRYPPEVPDTPELRFATVKVYLDLDSREAAAKAYADFRHCYPDDRWPLPLMRRLGKR